MSNQAEKGEWPSATIPSGWSWLDFKSAWTDCTDGKKKVKQREYDEEKGELNWKIVDFRFNGAIAYL